MTTIIRRLRSFVRRQRRCVQLTFPQSLLEQYGFNIDDTSNLIDYLNGFSACTLEIGFGTGDTLFQQAQENAKEAYVGIEVYKAGIKKLLFNIHEASIQNLRLLEGDAVEFLAQPALQNCFNTIQILFPDPWPKSKHHKRRLIQPSFLELLYQALKKEGILYLATDCEHYAYHMLSCLKESSFMNEAEGDAFVAKPSIIPLTKFEERGKRLGHGVWYLKFKK